MLMSFSFVFPYLGWEGFAGLISRYGLLPLRWFLGNCVISVKC